MIKTLFLLLFVVYTPETVPTEVGTYPVRVIQEDSSGKVETEIYMTVTDENTVISEGIVINANDFITSKDTVLTDEKIISMSNAKVWNMETLEEYQISEVKLFKVDEETYEAELYAFEELNTLIEIKIVDDYYSQIAVVNQEYNLDDYGVGNAYLYNMMMFHLITITLYIILFFIINTHNKKVITESNKLNQLFTNIKKP